MKNIYILFIIVFLATVQMVEAETVKINLGSDYIPEKNPVKANAMCNLYPNGAYKCFCKKGHYNGHARDYVWSSNNPAPDDNLLNTYPLYVRTPKCLKFNK